jgi:hypothetical protein
VARVEIGLRRFSTKKTSARGGGDRVMSVPCFVVDLEVELDVAGSAFKDSIGLHRLKYLGR